MKTSFEKKTNGLVALSVKIEKEELEKYIEEVFIKEKEKLQIKGFRIGQAPEEIAKDFISQEKIFNEAAEKAVKDSLKKVGEENGWILIDSPKVKFEEDKEGLSFKAELTLFPEVELPDYKIIAKRANEEVKEKIKKITVEEEEIKKAIEWLIEARGLEKEKELTDEIVKSMGDFKTVGDLKKSIKEGLRAEKIVREGDKNRAKIIDEILKKAKIEIPEVMVEKMREGMKSDLKKSLEGGKISFEEYIKKYYEKEEKLDERLKEKAEKEIRAHLVIDAVYKKENIEISEEEIKEEASKILTQTSPAERKNINTEKLYDYTFGKIKNEKVFKFLEEQE
ncbi:MAG: hypothetical protein A2430_00635 [Candidatus Liptonbacteria bacterium RIFOXYC1_FULL_36_8]|uniref:Uncharacterized protein n=3 Tax=Candidatus Liptoniibacteriota TaxID=1817909 RepID=A0A1G2CMM5_9BACT|nr:MAG: hypothetical protein A2390_01855 [Candidatus Liptonbacteria bacterium RIFOXYB1_FULL_36_10]OGZ02958.1 MAG: hypothetical protein A2430_00635 [Candidatus Liptonbacteria bacterium RIFOXYC1_FULL_36_8]OGZ03565.1 MAG: hypothetical protein A2604_00185 [Candidatus Liptonbacteria bacterium RIFOXYD1_FULL_36_11]